METEKPKRPSLGIPIAGSVIGAYWILTNMPSKAWLNAYAGALGFAFVIGSICHYFSVGGFSLEKEKSSVAKRAITILVSLALGMAFMFVTGSLKL